MQSLNSLSPTRRAKIIQDILITEKDLFLCDVAKNCPRSIAQPYDFKEDPFKTGFYAHSRWPGSATKDITTPILELKQGIGGITIEETYRKNSFKDAEADLVAFTYRFIDQIHTVQYIHNLNGIRTINDEDFYHFRYDMDLRNRTSDPKFHLQVTNNAPSFEVPQELDLRLFLNTVKNTWFDSNQVVKDSPYWANRR
jgi:hypothetical protein